MDETRLKAVIEAAFEDRSNVTAQTKGEVRDAVEAALDGLDEGRFRVAEKTGRGWVVNQWLKKAVLLSFRLNDMVSSRAAPARWAWWDKVPSKFEGWARKDFKKPPASAPCRTASCAARRTSPLASC
jgi:2,3,4,5-tetrahydropyridine-2,6-dicarboxylate N-succinyltransferase